MSSTTSVAIACGAGLGLGLWLLVIRLPRLGRPSLSARIAPYLMDVSPEARELARKSTADPLPVFGLLLRPVLTVVGSLASSAGTRAVEIRLRQAGLPPDIDRFRMSQVLSGVGGLAVGVGLATVAVPAIGLPLVSGVALLIVGTIGGVVVRSQLLRRRASARAERMTGELPTVLEFLTLSLSSGEAILDAVRRVSRISRGELAAELGRSVGEVGAGRPFVASLGDLAVGLQLPPLSRAVDQIAGAVDRGTPLAEVLHAQAQDAREEAGRRLLESAGKKEVAMLIPLVFLILPTTIAFAVLPGIYVLQVGF